tara:strand:- start:162 stop:656 length:495 start_codon:yes stop_codon:yes gene_type:complete
MIPQDPFRRPIPLQSLTDETGQWMWNRPPEYADVDDFVDAIEEKLTTNETARDDILDMLMIGATVEDVVNTLALAAFSQGKITPDAAEIAKVPLAAMILQMAIDKEIPVKIFSDFPEDREYEKDVDKLSLMSQVNPEGFKALEEGLNQEVDIQEEEQSFMDMEK